jgi:maltooligosyltrehalose trehalohydrolase
MRRAHRMPFGAEVGGDGTHFRLWAPAASEVEVVVEAAGAETELPMDPAGLGWYQRAVKGVGAGARYALRIDHRLLVPDPASRANPDGVHAKSRVVDPQAYSWRDGEWRGRRWTEAVIYELHVGTFTPAGTFAGAIERLDDLVDLGVTALELMPVAAFAGERNWGYDGVLPFAPAASYGAPEDLKRLVDLAHARGLMVLLDVVYNHLGPDGNCLQTCAPQFFDAHRETPWGRAINFDGDNSGTVRDFFIHNALYWLEEFHFDGLRIDAVHAIGDDGHPDFITELATQVRGYFGDARDVHLILENDRNEASRLARSPSGHPTLATAQWNDDLHHALHVIATGERDGYYVDYAKDPVARFGRALVEGFSFQGEPSAYRGGAVRGEASAHLPPTAFVSFVQNHDQVGNRALGERIAALADPDLLRTLTACMLLCPQTPLLFMGEEFAASTPFLFFCDFCGELADAVTRGRRAEIACLNPEFGALHDRIGRPGMPDPNAVETFAASKLDWSESTSRSGRRCRAFYRRCLAMRRRHIEPWLNELRHGGSFRFDGESLLRAEWRADDGRCLHLIANLGSEARAGVALPRGELVFATCNRLAPGAPARIARYSAAFIVEQT